MVGVFSLGLYQFDSEYGFITMDVAKRVFGEDQPVFMQLRVDDMFRSNEVVDAIVERFGSKAITTADLAESGGEGDDDDRWGRH